MAETRQQLGNDVCVVGAGVLGLLAIKNLLEQGLKVTAFERNEYIGGTWHVSLDPEQLTALSSTTANTSRQAVRKPTVHNASKRGLTSAEERLYRLSDAIRYPMILCSFR